MTKLDLGFKEVDKLRTGESENGNSRLKYKEVV